MCQTLEQPTELQDCCQTCTALVNLEYSLWVNNYYNSPSLFRLLRNNGINVAGTLHLYRQNVPQLVQSKKLAWGESATAEFNRIMVMEWSDKT